MGTNDLRTLQTISCISVARTNMLATYLGGSAQNRRREMGFLCYTDKHLYRPIQYRFVRSGEDMAKSSPYIYALTSKAKKHLADNGVSSFRPLDLKQAWHELMVSDIVLSIATACKARGLRFRFQHDIIGNDTLQFPCTVTHAFPKESHTHKGYLEPDYLFAINDTYFVLEADRSTETTNPTNLNHKSFLRNLLQYREVIRSGEYKKIIPNIIVLNVFLSEERALNVLNYMYGELDMMSKSVCFNAYTELKLHPDTYPKPLLDILDHKFARAGYPDTTLIEMLNR